MRMWASSDREAMNAANAWPLNAPPLSVTSLIRLTSPVAGSVSCSMSGMPLARRSASAIAVFTEEMASAPVHVGAMCQPYSYLE